MTDVPDWVTVTEDETVVWTDRPAVTPYLLTLGGEFLLIFVGVVLAVGDGLDSLVGVEFDPTVPVVQLPLWRVVALLLVGWGLLGIARTLLRWRSVRYLVTTEEIYRKTGLVSRTVTNTRLDQVQNTAFRQSWFGRLASYGDVEIDTAGTGGTEIVFENVANPDAVVDTITRQLDQVRSEPAQGR